MIHESEALDQARVRVLEQEKKLIESLSEKERVYYEAHRLALTKKTEEYFNDKNVWWNKI